MRPTRKASALSALVAVLGLATTRAELTVEHLRCEYLVNPLVIGERQPRLSWIVASPERGQRQTAYQIVAASSAKKLGRDEADLWDTGKVASDETLGITYAGQPLRSRAQVFWKVRVWDRDGRPSAWSQPAHWTMGLLMPADWQALWISAPGDPPPLRPPHNGFHSGLSASQDATKWVTVDLGASKSFDTVRLFPARPYDWPDTPGFLFPVRFRVEAADSPDFKPARTVFDQSSADLPNPGTNVLTCRFADSRARYVRLFVTKLKMRDAGQHGFALAEMEVLSGGTNIAAGAAVVASDSIESGGWRNAFLTDGQTTTRRPSGFEAQPVTMVRKSFNLPAPVQRAALHATALGAYELRLNGQRVGRNELAPEWTDYHQRVQYQNYEVRPLLREGENVLGAWLGDGWYAGRIGMSDSLVQKLRGVYGRKPRLLARLEVELTDGRRLVVASDGSWLTTQDGPIRSSDLLDGEVFDARREMPGWDAPGFEPEGWQPPLSARLDAFPVRLIAQPNEPIRVTRELKPVALAKPKPGIFVFDLGQNIVGRCRVNVSGPVGATVTLRHAEMTNDDGTIYAANLRGAPQTDRYTLRGNGTESFEPRFTYHGFRFVEVTGLPMRPTLDSLAGRVFNSSAPEVGAFECSHPGLNRLWTNILWTQRANLMSVPTDCPQRDERLGWMGDIQAFSQTAMFNMDLAGFFTKWMQDVRDAQAENGRFADFSPHPYGRNERFAGAPAWGDAGVIVPWRCYVNYADRRLLERHYDSAVRWVEYIRRENPDLLWRKGRGNDYNDWLNGDWVRQAGWPTKGGSVPKEVFATAFFAHSADLVSRMARVLGRDGEARKFAALFSAIQAAFNRAFVKPDGRIEGDTQAGYALALCFDLLPENLRGQAVRHLVESVERYGGHLSTGIQSTHRAMLELARAGQTDVAWQVLTNRTFPSWLYMLDNGATTVWERWDGYVRGRGFQDPGMNSFNHWAFGAVGEWMMRYVAGIQPDDQQPGFKHFTVAPCPGGGVTWAKGHYDSIRGQIMTEWHIRPGNFTLDVTVPANTTASVVVPCREPGEVTESGKPAAEGRGVKFVQIKAGSGLFEVESGRYRFESRHP